MGKTRCARHIRDLVQIPEIPSHNKFHDMRAIRRVWKVMRLQWEVICTEVKYLFMWTYRHRWHPHLLTSLMDENSAYHSYVLGRAGYPTAMH